MKPNKCVEYFQEYSEKNKTVKDGDITVDHRRLGDHQFFFGSAKFILSFEMTFSPKNPFDPYQPTRLIKLTRPRRPNRPTEHP